MTEKGLEISKATGMCSHGNFKSGCKKCNENARQTPDGTPDAEAVNSGESYASRIDAKMAAIARQSPGMSPESVRSQAEKEVDEGVNILAAIDKKIGWYRIEAEGKEQMETWKADVDRFLDALKKRDYPTLAGLLGLEHPRDIKTRIAVVEEEAAKLQIEVSEKTQVLIAIGLWIEKMQGGEYQMHSMLRRVVWKALTGDGQKMKDLLDKNGTPNCIDTSYITMAMAEQYGIPGQVVPIAESVTAHRYYKSDDGVISDYWGLRDSGTVALNDDIYRQRYSAAIL